MSNTSLKWYIVQTDPRSELLVSRQIKKIVNDLGLDQTLDLIPPTRISRARRHAFRPYFGFVFIKVEMSEVLRSQIESLNSVRGFVVEPATYLVEFEGGENSVVEAIQSINSMGRSKQIERGRFPYVVEDAKPFRLGRPGSKSYQFLDDFYEQREGESLPSRSEFIEVKLRYTEHVREAIREVDGIIDFVGGDHPLIKSGQRFDEHFHTKLVTLKDKVVERFLSHDYYLYVVQTYSQYESQVIQALNLRKSATEDALIRGESIDLFINSARFVPEEIDEHIEIGREQRVSSYIYVSMHMSPESWHLVRSIPRVSCFVGGKTLEEVRPVKQQPLTDSTPTHIQEEQVASSVNQSKYMPGDIVDIIDGPFATYLGEVQEIDVSQERIKVLIDPSRSIAQHKNASDRSRFTSELTFQAEVTLSQVKRFED
jgi:transcriptional antiterminator NusG